MTREIDVGARPVDGDFFLGRPGWKPIPFPTPVSDDLAYRHCATYRDSEQTIRRELIELVRTARRKVFVASFFLGDAELVAELVAAADRLVGGVYVISALDDKSLRRGLDELEDEAAEDREGDRKDPAERKRFDTLAGGGVYVRGHENCHAKFAVADDEVALVASANFTTRALQTTGESGVRVRDRAEAGRLARLFARLWHEGCTWEIPPVSHDERYTAERRTPVRWRGAVPPPQPGSSYGVIWTDGREQHILRHLREIVSSARRELLLATWCLNGMAETSELLLDSVAAATRQGARARMLVRAFNDRPGHRADAGVFADAGVEINPDSLTHAKGAIADGLRGALFSANFDAEHGLTRGVETGWRLDGTPLVRAAKTYFEHAMDHANGEFARRPAQRDLHDRILSRKLRSWPIPRHIKLEAAPSSWDRFAAEAQTDPVLFIATGAKEVRIDLLAGRSRLTLIRQDDRDTFHLKLRDHEEAVSTGQRLEGWLRTRGPTASEVHGVCPATFTRLG